jgi:predicted RNase H-like HicB family nuclease
MNTRKLVLPVEVEWQPEGVYYAECSLIPGCHAEGYTLGEVLENLEDVAHMLLECMREDGEALPEGLNPNGDSEPVLHVQIAVAVPV